MGNRLAAERLRGYLSGQATDVLSVFAALRAMGERAGKRAGLSAGDAEALGIDFAVDLLANAGALPVQSRRLDRYLWIVAMRYAVRTRNWLWRPRELPLDAASEWAVGGPDWVDRWCVQAAVDAALLRCEPEERRLYELCLREGRDCREAASELQISHAAARKRLERLRARLRRALSERDAVY